MPKIRYGVKFEDPPGFRADAVVGTTIFAIRREAKETQRLNGSLLELAQAAAFQEAHKVILVLVDPVLSRERIAATWSSLAEVLRTGLRGRMAIWIRREDEAGRHYDGFPSPPTQAEIAPLEEVLEGHEAGAKPRGPTHGDAQAEVLRVLVRAWLRGEGPITLASIGKIIGYTFKPVRTSLDELDRFLETHGKKGVALKAFPRDPWARLVHNAASVRGTVRFKNRTESGRTTDSLLNRIRKLERPDIAVGGVAGARHYCPDLDLIGLPRLDLCVHAYRSRPNLDFVRAIDPGLEQTATRGEACPLVVHFLYRKEPLFEDGRWADPVECLLDLHEIRLEAQALQLLRSFPPARKESF